MDSDQEIIKRGIPESPAAAVATDKIKEIQLRSDFDYSRETYYDIVQNGREAITEAMEVARSTEHPRAYEVLSKLLKDVGDVADKLMDLNKKRKDIEKSDMPLALPPGSTLNHNVFIGSTTELQKVLIQQDEIEAKEKDITPHDT